MLTAPESKEDLVTRALLQAKIKKQVKVCGPLYPTISWHKSIYVVNYSHAWFMYYRRFSSERTGSGYP